MRAESTEHGWHEMYADRYPHAGGEEHVALYLENSEGVEVEVVVRRVTPGGVVARDGPRV